MDDTSSNNEKAINAIPSHSSIAGFVSVKDIDVVTALTSCISTLKNIESTFGHSFIGVFFFAFDSSRNITIKDGIGTENGIVKIRGHKIISDDHFSVIGM